MSEIIEFPKRPKPIKTNGLAIIGPNMAQVFNDYFTMLDHNDPEDDFSHDEVDMMINSLFVAAVYDAAISQPSNDTKPKDD